MPNWLFILLVILILIGLVVLLRRLGVGGWILAAVIIAAVVLAGLTLGFSLTVGHHKAHVSAGAGPVTPKPHRTVPPATTPAGTTPSTTSPTGTTPTGTTPASPASPAASSGSATSGGAIAPNPGAPAVTTGTASGSGSASQTPCPADAYTGHGLSAYVSMGSPVEEGGSVNVVITVCKTDGQPLPSGTALAVGESWDHQVPTDYAVMHVSGVYQFLFRDRNWFLLPDFTQGTTFSIPATVEVPRLGDDNAVRFCLQPMIRHYGLNTSFDADGRPIYDWDEPLDNTTWMNCSVVTYR